MAWLRQPLADPDRHWDPEWGLHLLHDTDDPRDKSTCIFGAPDEMIKTKLPPKLMKTLFGENRELFAVCNNGTTAITLALSNSASPARVRLVAMGSYTGAYSFSENYSSVPVDIDSFFGRDSLELERIIALPYLSRREIGTATANKFEDDCLDTLKERLLGFATRGTPVGTICLELLLSGNGLQLSRRFCEKLRSLCTKTGIAIVADEILTGFRCVSEPTVLLADHLGLKPDFIVLGKFIGCGIVIKDTSMTTTSWSKKHRRYPTTNCPVVQLEQLSSVLFTVMNILEEEPTVFKAFEDVVTTVVKDKCEGRGLIWFVEDNITREVPAPGGVKRLLFKITRVSKWKGLNWTMLKGRLHRLSVVDLTRTRSSPSPLGSLGRHIQNFRIISQEFVSKWHNRTSTRFANKAPFLFGIAHATRILVEEGTALGRKKSLWDFITKRVSGLTPIVAKRIFNGIENNCGDSLLFLTTTSVGKHYIKVLKPTIFTLTFVDQGRKRRAPPAAAASAASASATATLVPVTRKPRVPPQPPIWLGVLLQSAQDVLRASMDLVPDEQFTGGSADEQFDGGDTWHECVGDEKTVSM